MKHAGNLRPLPPHHDLTIYLTDCFYFIFCPSPPGPRERRRAARRLLPESPITCWNHWGFIARRPLPGAVMDSPTFSGRRHEPFPRPARPMRQGTFGEGDMNNFSMLGADRMTHLKVVAMALVCATLVAGIGVAARVTDGAGDGRIEATVIKASKPMTASKSEDRTIR